jgi:Uma2 family endonuclease
MERPGIDGGERSSWQEFIALAEDDRRELLDGELLEIDVPTKLHEWVVALLVHRLTSWAMARRAGIVLASGYKVRIRENRGFMPDVQYFARAGRPLPSGGLDAGAPDLVVEVVSPVSRRFDRTIKAEGYAEIGVPEYWIVDPELRTLERLVLTGSAYRVAERWNGPGTFAPPSFPNLSIELSELWSLPDWFEE